MCTFSYFKKHMWLLSDWFVISKFFYIKRQELFFLFFFLTKENWVEWHCIRLLISFYDLFWSFLKRLPRNKSWKCRRTKSYQMKFMNINAFTINPIKIKRARWLHQTYGKRSLKKLTLMFFSAAKVNWLHSINSLSCNFETAVISC